MLKNEQIEPTTPVFDSEINILQRVSMRVLKTIRAF